MIGVCKTIIIKANKRFKKTGNKSKDNQKKRLEKGSIL